jgi:hypothetical protein
MAYGAIPVPAQLGELPTISYTLPDQRRLTCFPVTKETAPAGVAEYLLDIFNAELECKPSNLSVTALISPG